MSEENPFNIKEYYIYESPKWTDCKTAPIYGPMPNVSVVIKNTINQNISSIDFIEKQNTLPNFRRLGPKSIIEIEIYLSKQINNFLTNVKLAKTCANYKLAKLEPLPECDKTFTNYQYENFQTTFDLNNLYYTNTYISSKTDIEDKKELCQRLADINSLTKLFTEILKTVNTPDVKSKYKREYENIFKKYEENQNIRTILEQTLDNIYSTDSTHRDSVIMLDTTIYTSVIWTILATSIIFFIFKKM
jgi:hypothetical protein